MNENKNDARIAELGSLADKVIELYGLSLKMQKTGCNIDLYAGTNSVLLDTTSKFHNYWMKLKSIPMSEDEREKIRRITKRTEEKIKKMKQLGDK